MQQLFGYYWADNQMLLMAFEEEERQAEGIKCSRNMEAVL